jgi:hypothetical protein
VKKVIDFRKWQNVEAYEDCSHSSVSSNEVSWLLDVLDDMAAFAINERLPDVAVELHMVRCRIGTLIRSCN